MSLAKNWCFTLYAEDIVLDWLEINFGVYQKEICPTTQRPHYQGYIQLAKRKRLSFLKKLLPTAHWEVAKGTPAENYAYCTKEESRAPGSVPFEHGVLSSQGKRNDLDSFKEAVRLGARGQALLEDHSEVSAKYPNFVRAYIRGLEESLLPVVEFEHRYIWQRQLGLILESEPDARKVLWRAETTGNAGKSFFALNYKPAQTYYVTGGKHADIRYAYAGQPIVIFDWARSAMDRFPYDLVEQFKNGCFFVEKYESRMYRFKTPHVVVFSNERPDLNKLSMDRWDIQEITVVHS